MLCNALACGHLLVYIQHAFIWRSARFWVEIGLSEKQTESHLKTCRNYAEKTSRKPSEKTYRKPSDFRQFSGTIQYAENIPKAQFRRLSVYLKCSRTVTDLSLFDQCDAYIALFTLCTIIIN